MMKSFQRFIAIYIMKCFTFEIFNSFIFGKVEDISTIIQIINDRINNPNAVPLGNSGYLHTERQLISPIPTLSIIANILMIAFYVAMARELYLMYKYGKDEIQVKKESENK